MLPRNRISLAFSPTMLAELGEPLITIEAARIRLFRLPGEVPERAVIDTTLPFRDTDSTRTFSTSLTLTSFFVNPVIVTGGTSTTGTVTLSAVAPAGGASAGSLPDRPGRSPTPAPL